MIIGQRIDPNDPKLSIGTVCYVLGISRYSFYFSYIKDNHLWTTSDYAVDEFWKKIY